MDPLLRERDVDHLPRGAVRVRPAADGVRLREPARGEPGALQGSFAASGGADEIRGLSDMMSTFERGGGHGIADVERLREFYSINRFQMQIRGEGVKKSKSFADVINESPLVWRKEEGRNLSPSSSSSSFSPYSLVAAEPTRTASAN